MKKIIDVSGFGHSGKTAVSEFLADYEEVFSFPVNVEFEIFRVSGGILDLYYSIYHSWNLIRTKNSINEFRKLIHRIGIVQDNTKIVTLWKSSGHGYNRFFNNRFIEISESYINQLIVFKQKTFWPYEKLYISEFQLFFEKIKAKLLKKILLKNVYFTDRNIFLNLTSKYIHDLFNETEGSKSSHIVLNNAFDPFNPVVCLNIIENSFSIVVERDPRDIYASLINSEIGFVPKFEEKKIFKELKKKIVGSDNVDNFILRYKTIMKNIEYEENPRLLRIRYEDFVLKHEETKFKIFSLIGNHNLVKKSNKFNPEESKINIGIWKKYSNLPEMKKIQIELSDYCYQSEYL